MDQIFHDGVSRTPDHILGGVSLVIWAITIIVSIKYALLVLRAQNEGEGGVFALYGLLHDRSSRTARLMLWSLMLGAGLLLGDGMITPAISVLSAVEGLHVAAPHLGHLVIPFTDRPAAGACSPCNRAARRAIGKIFGPILLVWFAVIAALGVSQHRRASGRFSRPSIRSTACDFSSRAGGLEMFDILGAVMLVVTGGEAMYADLGHFGAAPIRARLVRDRLSGAAAQLSGAGELSALRRAGSPRGCCSTA